MADQIRLGIVGTGRMASRMMQALVTVPDFTVQAVASRDEARSREFASVFAVPHSFTSARDLSAHADVDAVYICSRSGAHVADALAAIDAGKPVLLEKPLATNIDDAISLCDAAHSKSCLLVENLWCLTLPAYRHMAERLNSQSFGKPVHLQFAFGYPVNADAHPSLFDPDDGGALLDRGVYGVSLAIHLLGPVKTVHATAQLDTNGVDLTSDMNLTHASGATSQITVSLNALMSNMATLSCTHGVLQLGAPVVGSESLLSQQMNPEGASQSPDSIMVETAGFKSRLKANPYLRKIKRLRDATAAKFIPHGADQYRPTLEHFRDLVRAGKTESSLLSLELSLATQRVLSDARDQCREG